MRINTEEDCPTQDFTEGDPSGECWSDGHYGCNSCIHLRRDFKIDPEKRNELLSGQGCITITTLTV